MIVLIDRILAGQAEEKEYPMPDFNLGETAYIATYQKAGIVYLKSNLR